MYNYFYSTTQYYPSESAEVSAIPMSGLGLINYQGFSLADTPSLKGYVCVITGGQAGIGKEIVAQLLLHEIAKVYVLARSLSKFESATQFWEQTHKIAPDDVAQRVEFLACDLSDITIVKQATNTLTEKLDRLDMLINNAGILS
jgi:NAD(P)-dependent dehydrogenase (short-subunit alcohol dehydrogenase family)